MNNTETKLLQALTEALMGEPLNVIITAEGAYRGRDGRNITMDFGDLDAGLIIGGRGATKLAVQTLLACPFGGDACHIMIRTTRDERSTYQPPATMALPRIEAIMQALELHYRPYPFRWRVEQSDTAIVVLVQANELFTDELRGPLARIIRAIGRRHGTNALVSVEPVEERKPALR